MVSDNKNWFQTSIYKPCFARHSLLAFRRGAPSATVFRGLSYFSCLPINSCAHLQTIQELYLVSMELCQLWSPFLLTLPFISPLSFDLRSLRWNFLTFDFEQLEPWLWTRVDTNETAPAANLIEQFFRCYFASLLLCLVSLARLAEEDNRGNFEKKENKREKNKNLGFGTKRETRTALFEKSWDTKKKIRMFKVIRYRREIYALGSWS